MAVHFRIESFVCVLGMHLHGILFKFHTHLFLLCVTFETLCNYLNENIDVFSTLNCLS